ncbi:MAG: hypothetical protein PHG05_03750 [Candidatus Nanoarchaeia archaeon]|nr:hypothetical protein [Candidatus Nanoarchaeia archaeon]
MQRIKEVNSVTKIRVLVFILIVLILAQALSFFFIFDLKNKEESGTIKCFKSEIIERSYNFDKCENPICQDSGAGTQTCVCSDNPEKQYKQRCVEAIKVIPVVYKVNE